LVGIFHFKFNVDTLSNYEFNRLKRILKPYLGSSVKYGIVGVKYGIVGGADITGPEKYNKDLSIRRENYIKR